MVIDLYRINFLVFKSETDPYLYFINESKKRCNPFFPYLNFINESGKRYELLALLKLYQQEWERVKIQFTIPKFLRVSDPYCFLAKAEDFYLTQKLRN